jgi:cytochrome P450
MELFSYFHDLSEERRKHPKGDIVSVVAGSTIHSKPLDPTELLSYYFLLVVAGNETTRNAMTGGLLAFLENPGEWQRLKAEPGIMDCAIEEVVRWTTPVIQFCRTATEDYELRGQTLREGQNVCLFYPSANRDEDIFDEPFRFRIDRSPNDHIGFGRGEHVCLGAHLARLELRCAFEQLRDRVVRIELAGRPVRVRSSFVGGIKRVPIRWELKTG